MLTVLNDLSHGFVAVPVILACRRWGLFERLRAARALPFSSLAASSNAGYLKVALHMLESLGWVTQPAPGCYQLTPEAAPEAIPSELLHLYRYTPEELISAQVPQDYLRGSIAAATEAPPATSAQVERLIEGSVCLPLLIALRHRQLAGHEVPTDGLTPQLRESVTALFCKHGWGSGSAAAFTLTVSGRQIIERAYVMAIAGSYRPMLLRIDELLFGDFTKVFRVDPVLGELHIDRKMNVLASGFQHERYFRETEALLLQVFNRLPLAEQPRYIADMGCGDGSFLKQIFTAIKDHTVRGEHLDEYPLRLIGIDFNRAALIETERTLAGLSPLLLHGDIGDPERMIQDLQALGISDPEHILHVRSFLDHNFRYTPPAPEPDADPLALSPCGVSVDEAGRVIEPQQLLQAWRQHLGRWARVLSPHGLIVLESHSLSAHLTRENFSSTESFYFDALHAFSQQHLIDAQNFLTLAAGVGLFPRLQPTRYPRTLPFCRITLSHLEKRDYIVRSAGMRDLDALWEIEQQCWPTGLRISREQISERIERYPEGQFVLEYPGPHREIAAVLYTQRISDAQALQGRTFRDVFMLHEAGAPLVQLLSLNVLPKMQERALGDQLLEFALQISSVTNGVRSGIGVTRCGDYAHQRDHALADYVRLRNQQGNLIDKVLRFHERHGAQVKGIVPGYRPEDAGNEGDGVLITYELWSRVREQHASKLHAVPASASQTPMERSRTSGARPDIAEFLEKLIRRFLGPSREHDFAADRPLMELGLDSADLLELNVQIGQAYGIRLDAAFFFQYNTPDKVRAYLEQQRGPGVGEPASIPEEEAGAPSPRLHDAADPAAAAIVGIACRLPDGIVSVDALWKLLREGGSAIGPIPPERLRWPTGIHPEGAHSGLDRGGFLREVDCFDASFFRVSPKEAESMDPQQRILLELAWEVLEEAGYAASNLAGSDTGVFIGASGSDYARLLDGSGCSPGSHFGTGSSMAVLANRISYFFDFHGPSLQLDTACSSSLVALHQALLALRSGESSLALVGGINLICHPANSIVYHKAGMLSPEGQCKTFDKRADGYVRAEGALMILVKPLAQALRDQDRVYAVIRGSATNHGGQASGLTVPNPQQQASLLTAAWRDAGIDPRTLGYVEAHGTGTALGDPIEVRGMKEAFAAFADARELPAATCGIGSIKSNLGHLEAAAGLAGLCKMVLCLMKGELVATRNFHELNPHIDLSRSPLYVCSQHTVWRSPGNPRRCGVSSFGSGGSNAHVVLEEFRPAPRSASAPSHPAGARPHLFVLSARDAERLRAYVEKLLAWLQQQELESASFADLVFTFQTGRQAMAERLALVVADAIELRQKLRLYLDNESGVAELYQGHIKHGRRGIGGGEGRDDADGRLARSAPGRQELQKLAALWVAGTAVDWVQLHAQAAGNPRRVTAPTYPFARERHWFKAGEKEATPPSTAASENPRSAPLHPILDRNESTLKEHKYQKRFEQHAFYLKDHVVQGHVILPGVAHLEMARAAAAHALSAPVHALRDIMWGRPLLVTDGAAPVEIVLALRADALAFTIRREDRQSDAAPWIYSQGFIDTGATGGTSPARFDLRAIRARCSTRLVKSECYAYLKRLGFQYGPAFQLTEELYASADEALVQLHVPEPLHGGFSDFVWHPSLLDAAVRAAFFIGLAHNDLNDSLRIPFSLATVRMFSALPRDCYSYARLVRKHPSGDYLADISILDAAGIELAHFKDFCFRRFTGAAASPGAKGQRAASFLYEPGWEPAPVLPGTPLAQATRDRQVLVLHPIGIEVSRLDEALGLPAAKRVIVAPGVEFSAPPSGPWRIRFENAADWRRLVSVLQQQGCGPTDILYFTATSITLGAQSEDPGEEPELAPQLRGGLYGLVHLVQALLAAEPRRPIRILVCAEREPHAVPVHATIAGLARALPGIAANVSIVTIEHDVASAPSLSMVRMLARELDSSSDTGTELRYQAGERLRRTLRPAREPSAQSATSAFKKYGTYLITGGLGGLGAHVATYLAREYQAKLVLLGRSEPGDRQLELLTQLKRSASQLVYVRADVADRHALRRALEEARQTVGSLHGVLHCAGVPGEPLTKDTPLAPFEQAIAAKVHGTVNLDLVTRDEPIELFVLFSSLAALLGDFARGSYSAASRFLDSFAEWRAGMTEKGRRRGKSLSVNWPYWKDGGFGRDFFRGKLGETSYFEQNGLTALETAEGMATLERALLCPGAQIVVAPGDRAKVERVLGISMPAMSASRSLAVQPAAAPQPVPVPELGPLLSAGPAVSAEELRTFAISYLTQLISTTTGLAAAKISVTEDLGSYGIDSLLITDMSSRLREEFSNLPGTLFFEFNNISDLAGYFVAHHAEKLQSLRPQPRSASPIEPARVRAVRSEALTARPHIEVRESAAVAPRENRDVAIIGMSGRYPQARTLAEFWENLVAGRDCIEEIPAERWDYRRYYSPHDPKPGQTNSKWGGFIADVDRFDPLFFNISPREAHSMDPQQRLFAEVAWEACEDAGYRWERFSNRAELPKENNVGVFLGSMFYDYVLLENESEIPTSYWNSFIANRISYFFNFRGPSIALDTACSSSLTALYLAYQSVRRGECHAAIAGGTNLSIHPKKYARLTHLNLLSSEGKCRSFGAGGSGYVPGEGVGAVLLKSLDDAVRDGDLIYGVIKGGAINHGGKTNGITVPNPNAQANLVLEALRDSRIHPRRVSYIETHGTGTSLGDPIEIAGLTRAFRHHTKDNQFCSIASVKSNIGHLEATAGIAAVTKVLLQMKHGLLVRSLHSEVLNPLIDFQNSPFRVQRELTEWQRPRIVEDGQEHEYPRTAGISSFGAGGSNAHLLIEEYVPATPARPIEVRMAAHPGPFLIPLSAKSPERLRAYAERLLQFVEHEIRRQGAGKASSRDRSESAAMTEPGMRIDIAPLTESIRLLLAGALGVDAALIEEGERFADYGVDRLLLLDARALIEEQTGLALPTSELLEKESLRELLGYVQAQRNLPPPPSSPTPQPTASRWHHDSEPALQLAELAYTLQIGREAMDERIGILASSLDELAGRIRGYLSPGEAGASGPTPRGGREAREVEGVFHAPGKPGKEALKAFLAEDDLASLLDGWFARRSYTKILDAWVKGFEVDWRRLYEGREPPRRISLPTYPFARDRYWVPSAESPPKQITPAGLHPLLSANVSSFAQQRFVSSFNGTESFFTDHIIGGRKLLPGVAFLEMARAAGQIAAERRVRAVCDVSFIRPLVAKADPVTAECVLRPDGDSARFEVLGPSAGTEAALCAHGRLSFAALASEPQRDLATIRARCTTRIEQAGCYALFHRLGFEYGPSFRCARAIWRGENECLSLLELPAEANGALDACLLHPALLDSSLHPVLVFCEGASLPANPAIPYALTALELHRPLGRRCYSHVVMAPGRSTASGTELRFDIELLDEQGELLIRFAGLWLRAAHKRPEPSGRVYYRSTWRPAPEMGRPGALPGGPLLLLEAPESGPSSWEHPALPHVIRVRPGKRFADLGKDGFEIDAGSAEDYRRLLQVLESSGAFPEYVAHALSTPPPSPAAQDGGTAERLERSIYSFFHLVRALVEKRREKPLRILYLYSEVQAGAEPLYGAMGGFARSLNQESTGLSCKTVSLADWAARADAVVWELQPENSQQPGVEVRYESRRRAVLDLERIEEMPLPTESRVLRERGVYLITGGAGGLGLCFAGFLAQRYKARVVLCGRSVLSREKQAELTRLAEPGGEIRYLQADVADRRAVISLIAEVKARYGALHGILHSAGVARNSYVRNKTRREIEEVLHAKIFGTLNLDAATQDLELDCFVLFSSISAVVEIVGQSDYSFANRFLDRFAAWREAQHRAGLRLGKTLSINWPLWQDGGMHVDAESQRYLKSSMGMALFPSQAGPEVLLRGLALPDSHFMVADGDGEKIDRCVVKLGRSAPSQKAAARAHATQSRAPEQADFAQLRRLILNKIATILQMDEAEVGLTTPLVDYGVDSITAMRFINQINKEYDLALAPSVLFEFLTIEALSRHLYEAHGEALRARSVIGTPPSAHAEEDEGAMAESPPAIPSVRLPLSHGQKALWFLHELAPTSAAYHIGLAFWIRSTLDVAAFHRSCCLLAERHPLLRARFPSPDGAPIAEILPSQEPLFELVDATGWSAGELQREVSARYRQPFEIRNGRLFRIHLFRARGDEQVCLLTIHHIVADAWSVWVLMNELGSIYPALKAGRPAPLHPVQATYEDYVVSGGEWLKTAASERQLEYWRQQLAGEAVMLNMPTDRQRGREQTFRGASVPFKLSAALSSKLAQLAQAERVTSFMLLLAAYQVLLHRYSGDEKIRVGSPTSDRSAERFYDTVGYFVNPVVLQVELSDAPVFTDFLQRVRDTVLQALKNKDYPFPLLVERLNPARQAGATPLFQAEFVYQNTHRHDRLLGLLAQEEGVVAELGGLRLAAFPLAQQEGQFDLTLELMEIESSISGSLKYNADLFDASTIGKMLEHYAVLLEGIAADPGASVRSYPLLTRHEQQRITAEWNRTQAEHPLTTPVHRFIEAQAQAHPEKSAVYFHAQQLSYRELNARANRLARHLASLGIGAGSLVGVCVPRSIEMLTALLAVLKAGAAYVPMDPSYPAARLSYMLEHAKASVLITMRSTAGMLHERAARVVYLDSDTDLIAQHEATDLQVDAPPESPAYVIYTSGSTGTPKGVAVPHRALTNFLCSMPKRLGYKSSDRMLAVTTISFDIAAMELLMPLVSGAAVVLADRDTASDGAALQRLLVTQQITTMQATPATWQLLLASGWEGSPGLTIYCGGEALPRSLAQQLLERGQAVWNLYGPTETTIWSTAGRVEEASHPRLSIAPIGRPLDNTTIYILDGALGAVPPGVLGDLYIGGTGLALGYLHEPALTAERFIANPYGAGRLYKTGDQARYLPDGEIEFVGRSDAQLKVRGFRIEPAEIEAALRKHGDLRDCVVIARNDLGSDKKLVAYAVPQPGRSPQPGALQSFLRGILPEYMVPSAIVLLDALPLTPNNKVDRKALPRPGRDALAVNRIVVPPRSVLEQQLLEIWASLLSQDRIGIHDKFFELGGTSMLAAQLIFRVKEVFGVQLPVGILFDRATIAELAQVLTEKMQPVPQRAPGSEPSDADLLGIFEQLQSAKLDLHTAERLLGVTQ